MSDETLKPVGGYITPDEAQQMIDLHSKERREMVKNQRGIEDTQSCWYTIAELMNYLQTIQENGADGVRIYFGVYPDSHPTYPGQQTIVFGPTSSGEVESDAEATATSETTTSTGERSRGSGLGRGLMYNHSQMSPP
jgi:ribosomal protein L31